MTTHAWQEARDRLLDQRDAVVKAWTRSLQYTRFTGLMPVQVQKSLDELYTLFCQAICAEPFDPAALSPLGSRLVELGFNRPESLSCTLSHLMNAVIQVSSELPSPLMARVPDIVAQIALTFNAHADRLIIKEHEEVSQAVFQSFRQLERALRESEERYRQVVRWLPDGLAIHVDGKIVFANQKLGEMLGVLPADNVIGQTIWAFIHPDDVERVRDELHKIHVKGYTVPIEVRIIRANGEVIYVEGISTLITYMNQKAILSLVRDVSDRKRAELELEEARRRLSMAREAERLHLAQELHDGIVQLLLGLSFQLARLGRRLKHDPEHPTETLAQSLNALRQDVLEIVKQLRLMIAELRPAGLEELGLIPAIETFVTQVQEAPQSPAIRLHLDERAARLPRDVAMCLFRVLQEAVRNAVKHADARRIDIILAVNASSVTLSVSDDGRGFTLPQRLSNLALENHFGLLGIEERVTSLGGTCDIQARPGRGTHITVTIHLEKETAHASTYSRSPR
ncbi:MAG: PAS domain-containing sensor histidine kinase [Ardenticatenia bacterium]|nr:PAS domain-containing sensor histidine kinase [Ardenticatenia bacterium]